MTMKKLLSMLMIATMLVSLVGCQGEPVDSEQESSARKEPASSEVTPPSEDKTEPSEDVSETTPTENDEYESYVGVAGGSIYVNYKEERRDDVEAFSIVFHNSASDMTAVVYEDEKNYSGTYKDVFAYMNDGRVFNDIVMYSDADFHDYSKTYIMDLKSSEDVKVNEYDMQRFTATVKDAKERECYAYGYTFVIDNNPFMLIGFVLSEAQEQELIDSINEEVDTMVKTVRTEM